MSLPQHKPVYTFSAVGIPTTPRRSDDCAGYIGADTVDPSQVLLGGFAAEIEYLAIAFGRGIVLDAQSSNYP